MMGGHMGSFINGHGFNGPSGFSQFGMMPYFNFSTLIFAALIAIGVYFLLKKRTFTKTKPGSIEAEEMVKLRYARGEIAYEEFQQILRSIHS